MNVLAEATNVECRGERNGLEDLAGLLKSSLRKSWPNWACFFLNSGVALTLRCILPRLILLLDANVMMLYIMNNHKARFWISLPRRLWTLCNNFYLPTEFKWGHDLIVFASESGIYLDVVLLKNTARVVYPWPTHRTGELYIKHSN